MGFVAMSAQVALALACVLVLVQLARRML